MPPLIWELPDAGDISRDVLEMLPSVAATWFVVPFGATQAAVAEMARALDRLADAARLVIAVDAAQLQLRRTRMVQDRLACFSRSRCEAILLQEITSSDVKAGSPFHRLSQLRDQGVTDLFFIDAPDHATAEWMLDHSPAHAICLPFGIGDQTARYRLFEDAASMGTGLIARPPRQTIWQPRSAVDRWADVAFTLAEPAIAAVLLPLPTAREDLQRWVESAAQEVGESDRQQWWSEFTQQVPPPAPLPRSTPPE